jgi:hypothetical protein
MTTFISDSSLRSTARLTGFLYFVFAAIGIYVFAYVQPQIIVRGDAAATGRNMLAKEFLYRTGLLGDAITAVLFVVIVLLFYKLLKHINQHRAQLMVALVVVSVPIAIAADVIEMTALAIFKGDILANTPREQAQDLAMVFIKISGNCGQMLTLFWGLWLFPLGMLIWASGFIPKIFGVLIIVNGVGYVVNNITFILFPGHLAAVSAVIFPTYFLGELPLIFWLLIKGVRGERKERAL